MSQVHIIDVEGGYPQIPTLFIGNIGSAVPIANELEILGDVALAGTTPLYTSMSGNTVTIFGQISQAIASTDVTKIGLASFDSTEFDVDANGFVTLIGGGGGAVMTVSGTANRITSTGGANPVIDIAATYVGQSSITTLGTISTGVWQGTTVGAIYGGTGISTYTTGDILYASALNTLSKLPIGTDADVLTVASGIPSWQTPSFSAISGTATTIGAVTADIITVDLSTVKGTFTFRASVAAYCSASTGADVDLGNGYTISGAVRTDGAAATQIGMEARDEFEEIAGATVDLVVSGNDGIIRVTGAANDTIKWKAVGEYIFVPFDQA